MKNEIVLVDTTIWIHFLRGAGAALQERLTPLIGADRLATAPVVVMEVLRGARSQKDYDRLEKDFSALRQFDTSVKVWERACRLAYALRKKGANVPLTDTLIAAIAQEHDALLLHDDRHYEMIAAIASLRHEQLKP